MKAIKNITDVELHKSAKKRKNSHENEPKYSDGYVDGAKDMREMAIKENHSLREKITELKKEILRYRKECYKAVSLAKSLAEKLEQKNK